MLQENIITDDNQNYNHVENLSEEYEIISIPNTISGKWTPRVK